jgi:DNA-binding MarR family transcriptional regulator
MAVEQFSPSDPTDMCFGGPVSLALAQASRLHRVVAGKLLRGNGLYPGQELLMMHLWKTGPVRQSDLIKVMGLDPSTVTKMLQRLQHAGHVTRVIDPTDRRAVLVEATEDSRALRCAIEDAWRALEERTVAALEPAERTELQHLLEKIGVSLCAEAPDCP